MRQAPIADLVRELGKTVVEALDKDAEKQRLDDGEHIVRTRSLIEALGRALERQQVDAIDPSEFEVEMRGFAQEVFVQRCRRVRAADGEPETAGASREDRRYFDGLIVPNGVADPRDPADGPERSSVNSIVELPPPADFRRSARWKGTMR